MKRIKPNKPYKDFPLFPASNGQWAKTIRGKRYNFGVWADPDAAIAFYERVRHDLYAGRTPSPESLGTQLTLEVLSNLFLDAKLRSVTAEEISRTTYLEYKRSCVVMVLCLGKDLDGTKMKPADFVKLRQHLAETCASVVTLKNHITRLKVFFRWTYESGTLDSPLPYRQAFKIPSSRLMRTSKVSNGKKTFEPAEIHKLLNAAAGYLKPCILLAINCGLGNKDCCELKWSHVNANGFLDFARPKTGVTRRAKLWWQTVMFLDAWKAESAGFAGDYICCSPHREKFGVTNTPIAHEFEDLAALAEVERYGRGFYALRHTYRTVADEVPDQPAIMLTMGHADGSINGVYRQRIGSERLIAIANHVEKWLDYKPK